MQAGNTSSCIELPLKKRLHRTKEEDFKVNRMLPLYAWFYMGGYVSGMVAFLWMAERRGFTSERTLHVLAVALIGGLVAANGVQWLVGGTPGKTVLGGIVGGYLSVMCYKRAIGEKRSYGDLFAIAIPAGEAVGRWGCFWGGCCYGKPCAGGWCVWQHEAWRYPTQAYLALGNLFILLVLLLLERRRLLPNSGLFCVQGILYCVLRWGVEFYRASPGWCLGWTVAQWACMAGILFFAIYLMRLFVPKARPSGSEPLPEKG